MNNQNDDTIHFRTQMYHKWKRANRMGCCEEWKNFETFCKWALESGFEEGDTLKKINVTLPFAPDNCFWLKRDIASGFDPFEFSNRWNKTVNRIREHYGMEPLEVMYE